MTILFEHETGRMSCPKHLPHSVRKVLLVDRSRRTLPGGWGRLDDERMGALRDFLGHEVRYLCDCCREEQEARHKDREASYGSA